MGNWYFGTTYCTANNFIANVSVAASVFTLTGISFDRKSGSPTTMTMVVNPRVDWMGDDPPPHYSYTSPSSSLSASRLMTCNQQSSQLKLVLSSSLSPSSLIG
uniref:(California timema) hypothetical protein n=1 Tax=Timema californicum TaxID=61474 RepID=A0A7R9JHA4_TIMCA|nr:unnamed protein product [Timema californicum]